MTPKPLVGERDIARTYDGSRYSGDVGSWDIVEQYRRVATYRLSNPDSGYTAIASALELPKGRVRSWYEGKTPAVVAGLETARDYGWLEIDTTDPAFEPLNTLVAGIYAAGSLNPDNWIPIFALNEHGFESAIVDALEAAGVGWQEHEEDRDGNRGPTIRPAHDGAVLGRVLHVLGVPIGKKAHLEDLSLPDYLDDAAADVRDSWVRTYLLHRGYEDRTSDSIQILEDRPRSYRRELADLIESVADAPVRAGDQSVTISAEAARALEVAPRYTAGW